ncbi:DUF2304 domain-containing protein [Flavihumibacter rivuli]|uniref:DUF2304 domain-containing protein n=1 Tax=Flavihumibacter rivuli TaxID=2838156 RepID=UPI001BDDEEC3|nr:DUF2304 domain-containing protein [Flavihumibacter rivuli]ULQ55717.1 DUF2304 domain-containing protein [Flavihumibacter rivuli]
MSGIQIILLTGILFIGFYFYSRMQRAIADVLLLLLLGTVAILFVLMPELANKLAHKLGVGRGADLVMYVSILLFWFILIKLYAKIRKLEAQVTDLIRNQTIAEVVKKEA